MSYGWGGGTQVERLQNEIQSVLARFRTEERARRIYETLLFNLAVLKYSSLQAQERESLYSHLLISLADYPEEDAARVQEGLHSQSVNLLPVHLEGLFCKSNPLRQWVSIVSPIYSANPLTRLQIQSHYSA